MQPQTELFHAPLLQRSEPEGATVEELKKWMSKELDVVYSALSEIQGEVNALKTKLTRETGNRHVALSQIRKLMNMTNGRRLKTVVAEEKKKQAKESIVPEGFVPITAYISQRLGPDAVTTNTASVLTKMRMFPSAKQVGSMKLWVAKQSELDYYINRVKK